MRELESLIDQADKERHAFIKKLEDVRDRVSTKTLEYGRRRYVQGEAVK